MSVFVRDTQNIYVVKCGNMNVEDSHNFWIAVFSLVIGNDLKRHSGIRSLEGQSRSK